MDSQFQLRDVESCKDVPPTLTRKNLDRLEIDRELSLQSEQPFKTLEKGTF